METKLILVDGITGSGKSTTAQFLAMQLLKNQQQVRWYHEEEGQHPLDYPYGDINELCTPEEIARFMQVVPDLWKRFVQQAMEIDQVQIIESYIYQDTMRILFQNNLSGEEILEFAQQIYEIIQPLNPVLVYFYQDDVHKSIDRIWAKRGPGWKEWFIRTDCQTPFVKSRGLEGEEAIYQLWGQYQDLTDQLFSHYPYSKLSIENSAGDWTTYRRQILDFIGLPMEEEAIYQVEGALEQYCGHYRGKGKLKELACEVELRDGQLYMKSEFLWPNIRLLPQGGNEFVIESFPIRLIFFGAGERQEKIIFDGADIYGLKGKEIWREE